MDPQILNFLKEFTDKPFKVDRLIVSTFLSINKLTVSKNSFLCKYLIKNVPQEEGILGDFILLIKNKLNNKFTLENLIELFEFVISPKEKIVTGAVYTPLNIREYIVSQTIPQTRLHNAKIADIACGCAGFLLTAAKYLKKYTTKKYFQIIGENLYGLDIADYSVTRSKIMLSLLALSNGEDTELKFNINVGNALDYNWKEGISSFPDNECFDYIIGNPPYVCSRNIDSSNKKLLEKWSVTKSGHPDLYIPFFEIALKILKSSGTLGYITVNTFFKSINGRILREHFSDLKYNFKIIDFRNEQVFKKRNTYTCICLIKKTKSEFIEYLHTSSSLISKIKPTSFSKNLYNSLDDYNGWNMGNKSLITTINKIEALPIKIFSKFTFSSGIATLKNNIYKFNHYKSDSKYFYIKTEKGSFKIERLVCREIINSNKVSTKKKLESIKENIIFPYRWNDFENKYTLINENEFLKLFPKAYYYLLNNQVALSKRDKGKGKYEAWYAYGRNQSLNIRGIKLFFPHITNDPSFVLSNDNKLLFYNGEAIVYEDEFELKVLKKILESPIFWFYITKTSKPYSSEYFSLGKNYMKQFSLPDLTQFEKRSFLKANKKESLDFLLTKYGLVKEDIDL